MADDANRRRSAAGELVREHALSCVKPDIVHVSSFFEGLGDDAVTSIGRFRPEIPTAVTLYDLIPYLNPDPYLADPAVKRWYLGKLSNLRAADLFLAISHHSRAEAVDALGLAEDRVAVVMPDADPQFRRMTFGLDAERGLLQRHALRRDFLMYTGGIDHRKNIDR